MDIDEKKIAEEINDGRTNSIQVFKESESSLKTGYTRFLCFHDFMVCT
jgi:hypothetical protein